MHTIYGHRFPIGMVNTIASAGDWFLPEIEPGDDLPQGFEGVKTVPVISIDQVVNEEMSIDDLQDCVSYPFFVISVDEDSDAIRSLSPRFASDRSRKDSASLIEEAIKRLSKNSVCLVALTVEELCPGGLDASDGIELAERFVKAGAQGIIASGGTLDFPALKVRRETKLKPERQLGKDVWPETWLSSALWLVGRVHVPVYAQGIVSDLEHTLPLAGRLGLSGVIDVSVKHPSSTLTMSKA